MTLQMFPLCRRSELEAESDWKDWLEQKRRDITKEKQMAEEGVMAIGVAW